MPQALRENGLDPSDIETHGYSVVGFNCGMGNKLAEVGRKVLKTNGIEDDVFLATEDIRRLPNQPQRGQIMVCELIDAGLLGEGIIPLLAEARVKMMKALDHKILPARATVYACCFEFGANLEKVHGFNMMQANHYRDADTMLDLDACIQRGVARQMTAPWECFKFDFENQDYPPAKNVILTTLQAGEINAIVFWYDLFIDEEGEIIFTNAPNSLPPVDFSLEDRDDYRPRYPRQAVQHFQGTYRKRVEEGEQVELQYGYDKAWIQFIWPGTEMVQKSDESGTMIPKPPQMPRHKVYYEQMSREMKELEQKLCGGMSYDEDMLADCFTAAERIALEPNGCQEYNIEPGQANFFHLMFFL